MAGFIGKSVSIKLKRDMGIFQGKIQAAQKDQITITNAFHNGCKMMNQNSEVTICKDEIESLEFIQIADAIEVANRTPARTPINTTISTNQRMESKSPHINKAHSKSPHNFSNKRTPGVAILRKPAPTNPGPLSTSVPNSFKPVNGNKKLKQRKNFDLMQTDNFSEEGDFDFELANSLFDKKEIFREIDNENTIGTAKNASQKPDLVRQLHKPEQKYRHDENVLDDMNLQFRNIQLEFKPKQEYTTDEPGIIIPSIPQSLRNRIQNLAADHGHTIERQNDFLARGATELALSLLGGSRRLSPKNRHQWPNVTIICDEAYNFPKSEVGLSTGRQLASFGLKVMVYVKTSSKSDKSSKELELFTATGNDFTGNVQDLFASDLMILAVSNMNQNSQIVRYVNQNRGMVMAIDPPATGISEITIRHAVVPILPLDDIGSTCGNLHLVNIGISEKFYKDTGVRYTPIFGSKFLIPCFLKP